MFLYKYGSITKYSLSALDQRKFWMSKPEKFNDPYELKFKKIDKQDLFLINGLQKIKDKNPHITDEEQLVTKVLEHYQNIIQNYGITCLSEHRDNMLMWSHYANDHYGFCLGFDVGDEAGKQGFYKVDYNVDYPDIDLENIYHKEGLMKVLWTKSIDWDYEDEWRKIIIEGDDLEPYNAELKEVFFGSRTPESEIQLVKTILKGENITYFRASINPYKFQIDIVPLELPPIE